jgi:DNA damage-binding protein 1
VKGVGGLDHAVWRSFSNDRMTSECRNFVDGDLIEQYLDLKQEEMHQVAEQMGVAADSITKLVEDLARLH